MNPLLLVSTRSTFLLIKVAYFQKMREVLENQGLREPNEIEPPCIEAMKVVAKHKLDLFQTTGKASLYK